MLLYLNADWRKDDISAPIHDSGRTSLEKDWPN